MQRLGLALLTTLTAMSSLACSDPEAGGDGDSGGTAGTTATGGTSGGGGTAAGGTGGTTGGSAGGSTGGSGGSGATGGTAPGGSGGDAGSAGSGGSGGAGYMFRSRCDQAATATVTTSDYMGTEEFYLFSNEAYEDGRLDNPVPEDMICRIRFDVRRTGTAPAGCEDLDGVPCEWTHEVEYSNPQVLADVDGVCANSEAKWDQAWIDMMDGSRVTYGYIYMFLGHDSVVLTYSEEMGQWIEIGRAFWDSMTTDFNFKVVKPCRY